MKKTKAINLPVKEKTRIVTLRDSQMICAEFRTFYRTYPDQEKLAISQITSSAGFYDFLYPIYELQMEDSEQFVSVFLSKANRIIHYTIISSGGITGTVVDIQLILRHAILLNAKALCLAHNHPSGNLTPSDADISLTRKVRDAAYLLDITTLDHLILARKGYYSFSDNGII